MRVFMTLAFSVFIFVLAAFHAPAFADQNDDAIIKRIIADSIANYPGRCGCPYQTMRNGKPCGRHSAYSKPGGHHVICYPRDVSKGMIEDYKRR